MRKLAAAGLLPLLFGCDGATTATSVPHDGGVTERDGAASPPDTGTTGRDGAVTRTDGGSSAGDAGLEVPLNHRPSGSACPTERGSAPGVCLNDAGVNTEGSCNTDSDCTKGANGRCVSTGPAVCMTVCSYDTCASDTDCPAHEPCLCRSGAADVTANSCVAGSGCRVDSDCGAGGYCSPSQADTCALAGYFCHSKGDTCVNDSDCGASGACAYSATALRWECGPRCAPPP